MLKLTESKIKKFIPIASLDKLLTSPKSEKLVQCNFSESEAK